MVHCPFSTTKEQIQMFVDEHRQWIGENLEQVKRRLTKRPVMTSEQVWKAKSLARMTLSAKVRFWAAKNGSDLWDDFYPPAGYLVGAAAAGESEL